MCPAESLSPGLLMAERRKRLLRVRHRRRCPALLLIRARPPGIEAVVRLMYAALRQSGEEIASDTHFRLVPSGRAGLFGRGDPG